MGLNTALLSMAGAAALAELAVVITPNVGTSVTVPKLASNRLLVAAPAVADQQDVRESVQFHSAKTSEVLSWLESHGFSFVVNDGDIAPDKTITLNVSNQSVESVAKAIALALGGHWERTDGIHVFKRGVDAQSWMNVPAGPGILWGDGVRGGKGGDDFDPTKMFGPDFAKNFNLDLQGKGMSPEAQKKLQEKMQKEFGPEFQQKLQKEIQGQFGPDFQKKMQDQFGAGSDFAKKIKDQFGEKFQNQFKGQDFKQMTPEQQNQFQKKMEDQFGPKFQKQMEDQFGPKFQKQMKDFGKKMETFGKQMEDQFGPKFEKQIEEMTKEAQQNGSKNFNQYYRMDPSARSKELTRVHRGPKVDGEKLLKSLTSDEKDQMRKQGYIWYNDLTREQKAMFNSLNGKFDFQYKKDDMSVRVRRN